MQDKSVIQQGLHGVDEARYDATRRDLATLTRASRLTQRGKQEAHRVQEALHRAEKY
jgi:hypothetical protein